MLILDLIDIVEGIIPRDMADSASTGDYVSLANHNHCAVVFASGLGTAADDPTITLQQATDASGGSVKDLNFTVIYRKQASTDLSAVGSWTRTTQTAANTYTNGTSGEEVFIWVVEFDAADLDADGGFEFLRATVNDLTTANAEGYICYLLSEPRYPRAPASKISPIA